MMLKRQSKEDLTTTENQLLDLLQNGPHSLFYLADRLKTDVLILSSTVDFQRLIRLGLIARISLTPTDILHAQGSYNLWNRDIALLGSDVLAYKMGKTRKEFLAFATQTIVDSLSLAIIQSLQLNEGYSAQIRNNEHLMYYLQKALHPPEDHRLGCRLKLNIPIVGMGAPAYAWLSPVAQTLGTELIIPEHAEIANAVGAASGKIMETTDVVIKPDTKGFLVHAPWGLQAFAELHTAIASAEQAAKEYISQRAVKAGATNFELSVNREDIYVGVSYYGSDRIFVECRLQVTAVGHSDWV